MIRNAPIEPHRSPPFYFRREEDAFTPSRLTRNPWMPDAIAGGPLAALFGEVIEGAGFDPVFEISRTTLDIFGKVPSVPLVPRVTTLRAGKQMQLHRVELLAESKIVAQSHVLLTRRLETPLVAPPFPYALPEAVADREFFPGASMAGAIRTRPIEGGVRTPGRGVTWLAMDGEVVEGVAPSPFVKACLFSDFGNGIGSATHPDEWSFANLDISVNFLRMPRGEWLLIDAATVMAGNGHGLARSTFADIDGIYAFGSQTIFVGSGT
jgi:Thioesterase-like superfamily